MALLTPEDIDSLLKRAVDGADVAVVGHRLENFSNLKGGILGTYRLLVVEFEDELKKRKTKSFFVKSRPESALINDTIMDDQLFLEEMHFFAEVQPLLAKVSPGEVWSPRCFLANKDVLVLEDLRVQGFAPRNDRTLDEASLTSAMATLARFHASSVLAEAHFGKSLKQLFPTCFNEKVYDDDTKLGQASICGFDTIARMADKLGLKSSSTVPRILERVRRLVRPAEGKLNVICHGDLWRNNLLFDGTAPTAKCVLVDFQLLRYASPMIDYSMLLSLSTTPFYRKTKNAELLLRHYYSVFRDVLVRSEMNPEIPSFEAVSKDFDTYRLAGMAYASLYLPGVYMKSEVFESIFNDPEVLQRYLIKDRMNLIGPVMDEDATYTEQMREIIEELLEEGERVIC